MSENNYENYGEANDLTDGERGAYFGQDEHAHQWRENSLRRRPAMWATMNELPRQGRSNSVDEQPQLPGTLGHTSGQTVELIPKDDMI